MGFVDNAKNSKLKGEKERKINTREMNVKSKTVSKKAKIERNEHEGAGWIQISSQWEKANEFGIKSESTNLSIESNMVTCSQCSVQYGN